MIQVNVTPFFSFGDQFLMELLTGTKPNKFDLDIHIGFKTRLPDEIFCHVHVNDASGRGPGFGETQFTPILKTLVKNGYKGYISVEVFEFDPDPQTIASRSLGYLKGILETLS